MSRWVRCSYGKRAGFVGAKICLFSELSKFFIPFFNVLREKLEFFYLFSDEIVSTLWIFGSFAATIGSAERIRPQTVSTFGEAKVTQNLQFTIFFLKC